MLLWIPLWHMDVRDYQVPHKTSFYPSLPIVTLSCDSSAALHASEEPCLGKILSLSFYTRSHHLALANLELTM